MKKKYILLTIAVLLTFIIFMPSVMAEDLINYNSICSNNGIKQAMKIVGYVIQIIRWIVPLIIIVLGMVDFGKAVISNDENAISKASGVLIRRLVAGIVVFFIPTIILALLNAIKVTDGIESTETGEFVACTKCLFDPYKSCDTSEN